ncbi:MAG: CotH kinase family protein [Planctomycetales bacterium]|nr:CotH kinase family protein [Planctomycetales bacterium]
MADRRRFAFEALEQRLALAAEPIITEFMASNDSTLLDGNGAASDWIELYNNGDQSVDLAGYALTDDAAELDKWTFPSTTLAPGEFLVVFASGNAVADSGGYLHTNFALSAGGEYLALVSPQGVVLSEFGSSTEDYPPQITDVSYGLAFESNTVDVVTPTSGVRYLVPANNSVDATWTGESFNDASWPAGTASIGYETSGSDYSSLIQTTVPGGTTTAYVRIPFMVDSASAQLSTLQMKYDDGFIAYLNGTKIASANAPFSPAYNSTATGEHPDSQAVQYVDFDVSGYSNLLHEGENTLAIHMLNRSSGSSDLLAVPHLTVGTGSLIEPVIEGFTISPTPGGANTNLLASSVEFSHVGGTFSAPFQLTLSTVDPTETIRYTTNGSLPSASSPIYTAPISISASTRVRAQAFGSAGQVGSVSSEAYTLTAGATSTFNSDLPIIVLENYGQGTPGFEFEDAWFSLYEVDQGDGRSSLADAASFTSFIGQHIRGSSTAGNPKTNLRVELRDDFGDDQGASLLGMPSESDWVLYAPYNFDRAMLRNTTFYDLFRQMGNYAARTRFVEVYANYNDGVLDEGDYMGVYVLMENIKRDSERVDIAELNPTQITEPDITGGYILKLDRSDGEPDASWYTDRGIPTLQDSTLVHVEPERAELTIEQRDYIRDYIQDFEDALFGPNSTDPVLGYEAYLDVDATIDHHIMRVFSKDPDGLRLSTYLVKDRGEKLSFGPIWDFDRSAGPDDDGRAADPTGWYLPDVEWFESDWWGPLFDDPDFRQAWSDRWQELRRGALSDANIQATIGGQAAEIAEAQERNFDRWTNIAPNGGPYADPGLTGWEAEVSHLTNWLIARAQWIDDQLIAAPGVSPAPGNVASNTVVTLVSNEPGGEIYYTLDGSDPRADGGGISPAAILYSGPFVVTESTYVFARAKGEIPTATPHSDSSYPGDESPPNTVDSNPFTKYLNFAGENSGLIITPNSGASILRSFQLTTANDAEGRDPASYEIYGTNDPVTSADNSTGLQEDWTLISSGSLSLPTARFTDGPVVSFSNSTSYTSYKIVFPTLKIANNAMQFADIHMYETSNGTGAQIQAAGDLTRAVHSVPPGSNVGGSEWSELAGGLYSVETPADPTNLRITELHYHPSEPTPAELALAPGTDSDEYEFIELRNIGSGAISLNGVTLSGGVTFDFSTGGITSLQPGATVLLVSNITAFEARYGDTLPVAGEFSGHLSNGGEQLVLLDSSAQTIHDFVYDDAAPWPLTPDGDGPSLEVVSVAGNYNSGANWQASATAGGTPGVVPGLAGDFNQDDAVNGADFLAWQRGYGSQYGASDLNDWETNFGTGATAAPLVASAVVAASEEPVAFADSAALESAEVEISSSPLVAPGSGTIDSALFARGSGRFVLLQSGATFAPTPRRAHDAGARANEAAFAAWDEGAADHRLSDEALSAVVTSHDESNRAGLLHRGRHRQEKSSLDADRGPTKLAAAIGSVWDHS